MSSLTTALFDGAFVSSHPSYYETKNGPIFGGLTGRASQALTKSNVRLIERPRVLSTRSNVPDVGIKWGRGIQEQGMPWEDFLVTKLPEGSRLPRNFKTFDFYDMETQTAISAKTLNTQTPSRLADPTKIYSSLKKNIDATSMFKEYVLSRKRITSAEISSRELHVAVPSKTQQNQWEQISKAIEYGKAKGVIVKVMETY